MKPNQFYPKAPWILFFPSICVLLHITDKPPRLLRPLLPFLHPPLGFLIQVCRLGRCCTPAAQFFEGSSGSPPWFMCWLLLLLTQMWKTSTTNNPATDSEGFFKGTHRLNCVSDVLIMFLLHFSGDRGHIWRKLHIKLHFWVFLFEIVVYQEQTKENGVWKKFYFLTWKIHSHNLPRVPNDREGKRGGAALCE